MIFKQKTIIVYEGVFNNAKIYDETTIHKIQAMAMVLHVCNIAHIDIFCGYENGNSVRFDWILQPTKNGEMAFFRQLTALFIRKEG